MGTLFPQIHSILGITRHFKRNWMLDDIFMPSSSPIPVSVQQRSTIKPQYFAQNTTFYFLVNHKMIVFLQASNDWVNEKWWTA